LQKAQLKQNQNQQQQQNNYKKGWNTMDTKIPVKQQNRDAPINSLEKDFNLWFNPDANIALKDKVVFNNEDLEIVKITPRIDKMTGLVHHFEVSINAI
jgi:hypothetical protein